MPKKESGLREEVFRMKSKILIVEDEKKIIELVRLYLEQDGYEVIEALDGRDGIDKFLSKTPDLVILDLMLPEMDGIEVCKEIRKISNTPIIILTAKTEEIDKVIGLEVGADDYVAKPFSPRELVARVKAVLRRAAPALIMTDEIAFSDLTINKVKHTVMRGEKKIELTPIEFNLLWIFASNPEQVFSRLQLIELTQGYAFEGYERTIDAHIKNLRQKIEKKPKEPELIKTVYGVGYKLE